MTKKNPDIKPSRGFIAELYDYIEIFVFSTIAVIMLFTCGVRLCRVSGASMEQTLYDGQALIVSNLFYKPTQGDIVVFHQTSDIYDRFNEPVVKRVIAMEKQWISIDKKTQTVTIYDENMENPKILDESAYRYLDSGAWTVPFAMDLETPVQVPKGCIFVMGDNRNNSGDSSTHPAIGFVDVRRVLGHAVLRIRPLTMFSSPQD